ncbi:uncharacterized protein LOC128963715 [Oppia nitens]|uniref:uncharacterized protein LOC128963715 n=1 Tax=Oppia nitens TaxID=1686743 RepID=UPI0023DA36B3|nr:uncharacterized protein LOC128963715 [Oppia nitens]
MDEKRPSIGRKGSESEMSDMDIFGFGNPLIDVVTRVNDDFLAKYNLGKNATVLAEPNHEAIFDEFVDQSAEDLDIDYMPGGTIQNALRYTQWIVGKNNPVANYIGAVGDDYYGKLLQKKVKQEDGLGVRYKCVPDMATGTSVILCSADGKTKSVVTNLGASRKFDNHYLMSNFWFCERARLVLTSGHMLAVCSNAVMFTAKHCQEWGKDFVFNIGASYVTNRFKRELNTLMPYIDFLFCNSDEAQAYAAINGYNSQDIREIAKMLASEPKMSYKNANIPNHYKSQRTVIVTQRDNQPVLVASSLSDEVDEYPVPELSNDEFKDTVGSGDALIGGFLAMYIDGRTVDECIRCGLYCAAECCKQIGCVLPPMMTFKPEDDSYVNNNNVIKTNDSKTNHNSINEEEEEDNEDEEEEEYEEKEVYA